MAVLSSTCAYAQVFTFSKQELIDYTAKSLFDRLALLWNRSPGESEAWPIH